MVTAEGAFPKVGNDPIYYSEINSMLAKSFIYAGINNIRDAMESTIIFNSPQGGYDGWTVAYPTVSGQNYDQYVNTAPDSTTAAYIQPGDAAIYRPNKYAYRPWHISTGAETNTETTNGGTAASITITCTAVANHIITAVGVQGDSTAGNGTVTLNIKRDGTTLATASYTRNWYSYKHTFTFTQGQYSDYLHTSDTYTIELSFDGGSHLRYLGSQSFSGTYFSFSNQTINGANGESVDLTATQVLTTNTGLIEHTIPANTFGSTIKWAVGVPWFSEWESGAGLQYKLTNGSGNDTGWLACGNSPTPGSFSQFSAQPTKLIIRLTPKSSSPTLNYPSIKGFFVRAE